MNAPSSNSRWKFVPAHDLARRPVPALGLRRSGLPPVLDSFIGYGVAFPTVHQIPVATFSARQLRVDRLHSHHG